jgi:hypothetical protein
MILASRAFLEVLKRNVSVWGMCGSGEEERVVLKYIYMATCSTPDKLFFSHLDAVDISLAKEHGRHNEISVTSLKSIGE